MPDQYVGCAVKSLPRGEWVAAARRAIFVNPGNKPASPPSLAEFAPMPVEHIAALTGKVWGPKGVRLTVSFMDNPDATTRAKIIQHANAWGRGANVTFTEVASGGQVRIARQRGQGYWSYLGTDILGIPYAQPTMNLEGFDAGSTPDSEFYRVVRHEFGHTLGWPHEHMRKQIVALIDPQKAIEYFGRTQGWDEQTVRAQVLTPLSDEDLTALPSDVLSIMAYHLPPEITINGQEIPGGSDINDEDIALCAKLYPLSDPGGGKPPPTQPPPGASSGKLLTLDFTGRPVRMGGRVTFTTPVAIPGGRYDLVPEVVAGQAEVEAEVTFPPQPK